MTNYCTNVYFICRSDETRVIKQNWGLWFYSINIKQHCFSVPGSKCLILLFMFVFMEKEEQRVRKSTVGDSFFFLVWYWLCPTVFAMSTHFCVFLFLHKCGNSSTKWEKRWLWESVKKKNILPLPRYSGIFLFFIVFFFFLYFRKKRFNPNCC